MRESILYLLQNLFVIDVLILLLWFLEKQLSWKSGHLWRKWLWLLFCLRVLFPVELHLQDLNPEWTGVKLEIAVPVREATETEAVISGEGAETEESTGQSRLDAAGVSITDAEILPDAQDIQQNTQTMEELLESADTKSLSQFILKNWELLLLTVWFGGFVIALFRHVFQYYLVKDYYFAEASCCQEEAHLRLLRKLCKAYKIRAVPQLLEKEDVAAPMTFGYLKRKLIYPPQRYGEQEFSLILRHELTHIKYGDAWYKGLILFVCDLYWFNPLFLLMKRMAFRDVEYVCDERIMRGSTPEEKKLYGTAILKTSRNRSGKAIPSMVQFAVEKKELKKRLQNLFLFQNWKRGLVPLAFFSLFTLICILGVTVSVKEIPVKAADFSENAEGAEVEETDTGTDPEGLKPELTWSVEDEPIASTYGTDDLQALERQKDVVSSYITERFTGFNHYFIDENGTLWGTGNNENWQLGIPKKTDINNLDVSYAEPVRIAEDVIHVDASVNSVFVIYLTADGKLYGLGANTYGVLRMPLIEEEMLNPWLNLAAEPQLLMEHVAFASAGRTSVSVLTEDGQVYWWGLFQATTGTSGVGKFYSQEPMLMLENARYTVCGCDSAAAIDADNNLWTWGCNVWGQCGEDAPDYIKEPILADTDVEMVWVELLSSRQNIFDVEAWMGMNPYNDPDTGCLYSYTTFARKTDGKMYACGMDLGHNSKNVYYYGDLYIENSDYPELYLRDYTADFLQIAVEENPR